METSQARHIVVGVVVCILVAFGVIAGSLLAVYGEPAQALGVGAFAAFWGGGGFGVIAGIAVHHLRTEADDTVT